MHQTSATFTMSREESQELNSLLLPSEWVNPPKLETMIITEDQSLLTPNIKNIQIQRH